MEKHFMIDIEATGIDPAKEDLLQIGILETEFKDGFWQPGRSLLLHQNTERKPESEFAKEHMMDLYMRCNAYPAIPVLIMRRLMLDFFERCGARSPHVYMMGWNASNFDLPFLFHKGYLIPSSYETQPDGKDMMVGDVHYRVYEIGGAVNLVGDALGVSDRKQLLSIAERRIDLPELPTNGKQHDALYDCYRQLKLLNGLIKMARDRS